MLKNFKSCKKELKKKLEFERVGGIACGGVIGMKYNPCLMYPLMYNLISVENIHHLFPSFRIYCQPFAAEIFKCFCFRVSLCRIDGEDEAEFGGEKGDDVPRTLENTFSAGGEKKLSKYTKMCIRKS